jgi:hypothetical protein
VSAKHKISTSKEVVPGTIKMFEWSFLAFSFILFADSLCHYSSKDYSQIAALRLGIVATFFMNIFLGVLWLTTMLIPFFLAIATSRKQSRIALWIVIIAVFIFDISILLQISHFNVDIGVSILEMVPANFGLFMLFKKQSVQYIAIQRSLKTN